MGTRQKLQQFLQTVIKRYNPSNDTDNGTAITCDGDNDNNKQKWVYLNKSFGWG